MFVITCQSVIPSVEEFMFDFGQNCYKTVFVPLL